MNFNTESKVAESDAQQPGGGCNLSASTTRTPVTGVAVPPASLWAGAGLNATAIEEEMKPPRDVGMLQEYKQWMDQEEKVNKEENMETEQEEMSKVSNPTAAAAPTITYSYDEEDMEGVAAGGGEVGAIGGGE